MAITASVIANRTTGVAPFPLIINCAGTTQTDNTDPFHSLLYEFNFGDPDSGEWVVGSRTFSKNYGIGPVVAHLYETPGTYTVFYRIRGTNGDIVTGTVAITVQTIAAFYTGGITAVSANTLPVAGVGGVPATATCVTQSNWATIVNTYKGDNKLILLKGGDTFTGAQPSNLEGLDGFSIGNYGTGRAKILCPGAGDFSLFNLANADAQNNDTRLYGLEVDGNASSVDLVSYTGGVSNLLFFDIDAYDLPTGIQFDTDASDGMYLWECEISDLRGGVGFYARGANAAAMGCNIGDFEATAEHCLRWMGVQTGVIGYNRLANPGAGGGGKLAAALRPNKTIAPDIPMRRINVCYNEMVGNDYATLHSEFMVEDMVCEGNAYSTTGAGLVRTNGTKQTFRNEILTGGTSATTGYLIVDNGEDAGVASTIHIYNPTITSDRVSGSFVHVTNEAGNTSVTNEIKNVLAYAPGISSTVVSAPAQTVVGGNSTNAQAGGSEPIPFIGPLTSINGYKISASSYAATGGTATGVPVSAYGNDLFNGFDLGNDAQRMGAAGPASQYSYRSVP